MCLWINWCLSEQLFWRFGKPCWIELSQVVGFSRLTQALKPGQVSDGINFSNHKY